MGERVRERGAEPRSILPPLPDPLPHSHRGNALSVNAFERDGCGGEGTKTQKAQLQNWRFRLHGIVHCDLECQIRIDEPLTASGRSTVAPRPNSSPQVKFHPHHEPANLQPVFSNVLCGSEYFLASRQCSRACLYRNQQLFTVCVSWPFVISCGGKLEIGLHGLGHSGPARASL